MEVDVLTKDIPYQTLFELMRDAFQERKEQGLQFGCINSSFEDFVKNLEGKTIIVVRNGNRIIGFQKLYHNNKYMSCGLIAVSPSYKRQGIGALLFKASQEIAQKNGCEYLIADTAVKAKSSVKWHLKNGYKIIGLASWPNTNYYSCCFRKQLKYHYLWSSPLFCKLHYWYSAIKCRLCYYENGKSKKIHDSYLKIRRR